jgi:MFS family permease
MAEEIHLLGAYRGAPKRDLPDPFVPGEDVSEQSNPTDNSMPSRLDGISHAWRALRHRNFRLFAAGQTVSLVGNWMTRMATNWLVYRLTHSALLLGVVGFSGQILTFLFAPFAGVWIERLDRRKLLMWAQVIAAAQSVTMAVLTLTHIITVWEVVLLAALQGLVNAFDMPARQSFLVQMVDDRKDLGNAVAINSSMTNGTRLIGPALAGFVIAAVGEGWCFLLDGLSYLAVIVSLLLMRVKPLNIQRQAASMLDQLHEGWQYVRCRVEGQTKHEGPIHKADWAIAHRFREWPRKFISLSEFKIRSNIEFGRSVQAACIVPHEVFIAGRHSILGFVPGSSSRDRNARIGLFCATASRLDDEITAH